MNTLVKVTLAAALILSIAVPYIAFMIGEKTKGRYKKALAGNVVMFFGVMAITCVFFLSGNAYAASETAASSATGLGYSSFSRSCMYRWRYRRICGSFSSTWSYQ